MRLWLLALTLVALAVPPAGAHDFSITRAVVLLKADDSYVVDLHLHLDALALGMPASTPASETVPAIQALSPSELEVVLTDLTRLLHKRIRLRIDRDKAVPLVSFPEFERPLPLPPGGDPTVLGATARLTGRLPGETRQITFGASRAFNAVELVIFEERTGRSVQHLLIPGADSAPFVLNQVATTQAVEGLAAPARDTAPGVTFGQYLLLGFLHILPKGLDHVLFVLGLFFASTKLTPLLWQVSMFTLAHTVTLALGSYGLVRIPGSIVEPLIALSIVYVAFENLSSQTMRPWRPALVFAFGLLHGLGFAGVLQELGLPDNRLAEALLGFNVGVEFGQLAVVALAFLTVGWFRPAQWYRRAIVIPGSLAVGLMGAYWLIERTLL